MNKNQVPELLALSALRLWSSSSSSPLNISQTPFQGVFAESQELSWLLSQPKGQRGKLWQFSSYENLKLLQGNRKTNSVLDKYIYSKELIFLVTPESKCSKCLPRGPANPSPTRAMTSSPQVHKWVSQAGLAHFPAPNRAAMSCSGSHALASIN